jgi:hypothetical protein
MKAAFLLGLLAPSGSALAEPLIIDNGRLFITARINGVQTEALLDSGAEATLVDPVLAREPKFGPGKAMQSRGSGGEQEVSVVPNVSIEGGGIAGEIERDLVVIPELTLAGRAFANVDASVDATSSRAELNVGTPILKYFVATADLKGRAAWFEPVEEPRN